MIPTTYYMERTAAMPAAAPMGVAGLIRDAGIGCSIPSAQHRAAFGLAVGNATKPRAYWMDRQIGLTTDRSTRHLGRPST